MNFYRSKNRKKFIATDSNRCTIISITPSGNNHSTYRFPFIKLEGEVYEDSTYDEFFKAYDDITAFMSDIAKTHINKQGVNALLPDAKKEHFVYKS